MGGRGAGPVMVVVWMTLPTLINRKDVTCKSLIINDLRRRAARHVPIRKLLTSP